jgi:hypothetical protein
MNLFGLGLLTQTIGLSVSPFVRPAPCSSRGCTSVNTKAGHPIGGAPRRFDLFRSGKVPLIKGITYTVILLPLPVTFKHIKSASHSGYTLFVFPHLGGMSDAAERLA